MAFGFDVFPGELNFPISADQVRDARNALVRTAHELFQAPSAISLEHLVGRIAEQWKVKLLLGFEACECFRRIGADPKNGDALLIEF